MSRPGIFFVPPELQKRLDNLPADEPRSKLEPFRASILRWICDGRSYERIRRILWDECQVKVSISTIHEFVQRRSRPRRAQTEPEVERPTITPAAGDRSQQATLPTATGHDEYAEARERMRRHKEEPAVPRTPKRLFEYTEQDSIDPIVLLPKTEKEK